MNTSDTLETTETATAYQSQLAAARAVNNAWKFEGRELEKFVARGEASVATVVTNRKTGEKTGTRLIHVFGWERDSPFITRESALITKMSRIGRSKEQDIDSAHLATVNAAFYKTIVQGGILRKLGENGETTERQLSRDEMLRHANLYPESASEAIESWLEAGKCEFLDDDAADAGDDEYLFTAEDTVRILWYLGSRDNPAAAAILTFKTPSSDARSNFDNSQQQIKSKKHGDVNTAELRENFPKKLQYGLKYLLSVEGVAVETEGRDFALELKNKFVTLFNPIWFADAVETMQESFDFLKTESENN